METAKNEDGVRMDGRLHGRDDQGHGFFFLSAVWCCYRSEASGTTEKVLLIARYYSSGIFKNEPHPFRPSQLNKHNPLQRLTYLGVLLFISPLIWITGLLYLFYNDWKAWGLEKLQLEWIALGHTIGAFLMLAFLVSHLYLATTGHTPLAHIKAMITGWDEVGDEHEKQAS